jgi:YidC/Oxa1 family membrane protein insertase
MIYFFPVMMLFIFNQFPSGLNLYYTVFNVLTIAQQHFVKINEDEFKLKKPKRGGLAIARKKKK